jgi:hypothetical protein
MNLSKLLTQHPTPWTVNEKSEFDYYTVRDANKKSVVMVCAVVETSTEDVNDKGDVVRTTIKTPRTGALELARAIAEIGTRIDG